MTRLLPALLLALLLTAPPARSQYALSHTVVAAGATDASGGAYALRGTVGQPAVGYVAGGAYSLDQGFWPGVLAGGAPPSPDLTITLTPLGGTITIPPQGGPFDFRVTITNHTGSPQTFQAWTEAALPNGGRRHALGPQTLTLAPGATLGPVTLRQHVPGAAPPGTYTYSGVVGTYPATVIDTDAFTFTKAQALAVGAQEPHAATQTARGFTSGEARESREATTSVRHGATLPTEGPSSYTARAALPAADGWTIVVVSSGEPLAHDGDLLAAALGEEAERVAASHEETAAEAAAASNVLEAPSSVTLHAAAPNPFSGRTTLRFDLPETGPVRLGVYDVLGRAVAVLVAGAREAGRHTVAFDASALPSGTYLVRLEVGGAVQTQRVTRLR